jgi:GNAT superfamily N-acetyltransferase
VEPAHDIDTREVLACDESFFAALLAADHDLLGTILAGDFLIIDVLSGQVARREELLGAISSGQLRFTEVTRYAEERSVRLRDSAAVVAGRTQMVMRYQGNEVTAHSRYTHVYTRDSGRWRLLSAFAAFGSPVQVELAHLADPAIGAALAGRGYRLESFENVLGRALTGGSERVMPPGVEVRPSGEEEFETWLDVVAEGSVNPDTQGVPWHEEFSREAIIGAERDSAAAGDVRYAALRDGVIVGGATMRIAEGVAQLTGAATVPAHRRRGVQTALLSARLADAAAAGCDVAVITTQPGSKSQQNAQRQGFDLLYTRAVLVKQP